MQTNQTIAAVATPYGVGALAVIRVSGPEALAVCSRTVRPAGDAPFAETPSHTVRYGRVVDPDTGETVDEVLAAVFRAPRSFTTEDVVEISCHGGALVTRRVLDCALRAGARLAEPGEFTRRAFLGGRLDLTQAEAVIDVINAKTERALHAAQAQLGGVLSARIERIRSDLLTLCARLNALADFPDEDVESMTEDDLARALVPIEDQLADLLQTAQTGRLIREGIRTVILGKPNVGKSSLLNALAGEDRAIVTDVAGTTRDVVTETVDIGGVALDVCDTAGIHESDDPIERLGMEKSRRSAERADLVLLVLDASAPLTAEDRASYAAASGRAVVAVLNKTDLGASLTSDAVRDAFDVADVVPLSARTGDGVDALRSCLKELFGLGKIPTEPDGMLTNLRQQESVRHALENVRRALSALRDGIPMDMASVDLLAAVSALGEASGKTVTEEMVDRIFSQFCLGK